MMTLNKNELLLIPDKPDVERDAVASVWEASGGVVKRIGKFWEKPAVAEKRVTLYGFDSFCLVLAQLLGLELRSPRDEVVVELAEAFTKRRMELRPLGRAVDLDFPIFIKSVVPKLFPAKVYSSIEELQQYTVGLQEQERLICSAVLVIEKEVRCFIFNQQILDLAFYQGSGEQHEVRAWVNSFLQDTTYDLPESYVLDLAYQAELGWFILEFNAAWGAGLNYCRPELVVAGIRAATQLPKPIS